MQRPPDIRGLLRAKQEADERKLRETDLMHRLIEADRAALEAECIGAGIDPGGHTDDSLRSALLNWHKRQLSKA